MNYYTQKERLQIVLDIASKLKNFKSKDGSIINLYNENLCSFIIELKQIFSNYIKQDENNLIEMKGTLLFEEIGKNIEYLLPIKKNKKSLFVIRGK
jgi:hypothetical protein